MAYLSILLAQKGFVCSLGHVVRKGSVGRGLWRNAGLRMAPALLSLDRKARHLSVLRKKLDVSASDDLASLSGAINADPVDIPSLNGTLRPYQHVGVRYALSARRCFIADEMGTGKTVQALASLEASDTYPAVVVTPLVTKSHWERHASKWLPHRKLKVLSGNIQDDDLEVPLVESKQEARLRDMKVKELSEELKKRGLTSTGRKKDLQDRLRKALGEESEQTDGNVETRSSIYQRHSVGMSDDSQLKDQYDIFLVHYDILHKWEEWLDGRVKSMVFDEAHYIRNARARRSTSAERLAEGIRRRKDDGIILMLTGTPLVNRPADLIHPLKLIGGLNTFGGWYKFVRRYCQGYKSRFGWQIDGAANLQELQSSLRQFCFLRRTKEQVMPQLPPLSWVEIMIEPENIESSLMKKYRKAQEDVVQYLGELIESAKNDDSLKDEGRLSRMRNILSESAETLLKIQTLRELSNILKRELVYGWIRDFFASTHDDKLIVFAHHHAVIEGILDEFPESMAIYGKNKYEENMSAVDNFQSVEKGSCPLVVCSLTGASVGIELTQASNVLFVEQDWSPAVMDQAAARAHRGGQSRPVTAWVMMVRETIDEDIAQLISGKRKNIQEATDKGSAYGGTMVNYTTSVYDQLVLAMALKASDV